MIVLGHIRPCVCHMVLRKNLRGHGKSVNIKKKLQKKQYKLANTSHIQPLFTISSQKYPLGD